MGANSCHRLSACITTFSTRLKHLCNWDGGCPCTFRCMRGGTSPFDAASVCQGRIGITTRPLPAVGQFCQIVCPDDKINDALWITDVYVRMSVGGRQTAERVKRSFPDLALLVKTANMLFVFFLLVFIAHPSRRLLARLECTVSAFT